MADIPIVGVPSNFRNPGFYAQVLPAQGASSASAGTRDSCLVMPMLSTGSFTAGQVYQVKNENDAELGAGSGSWLHRGARMWFKTNKTGKLFVVPVAETSGGSPAKADLDSTLVGTATGAGTATITVCNEVCSAAFKTGDTAATIGAALVESVNAKTWLPVVATGTATVKLEAKHNGISSGDGTLPVIRVQVDVSAGKGITFATENSATNDFLGSGTGTAGAEGSTTESTGLTAALGNVTARLFYYMGFSAQDATSWDNINSHIATKSDPRPGLRSTYWVASTHPTQATLTTTVTGDNSARGHCVYQKNGQLPPADMAANVMAIVQKREELDKAFNFDNYREPDFHIPPAFDTADWFDDDDINDGINDGMIMIQSGEGAAEIVMMVNNQSKAASGTVDDFRATERHRISVADWYANTMQVRHLTTYKGKKLADDQRLANGQVNPNQRRRRGVITPSIYSLPIELLDEGFELGYLQNIEDSLESLERSIDPQNGGRLEVGVNINAINLLHQLTARIAETSSG